MLTFSFISTLFHFQNLLSSHSYSVLMRLELNQFIVLYSHNGLDILNHFFKIWLVIIHNSTRRIKRQLYWTLVSLTVDNRTFHNCFLIIRYQLIQNYFFISFALLSLNAINFLDNLKFINLN